MSMKGEQTHTAQNLGRIETVDPTAVLNNDYTRAQILSFPTKSRSSWKRKALAT